MNGIRASVLCIATWAASLALPSAAGMTPDPTGHWARAGEPGWGMTVTQQGDVIFAVIFIYDAARRAAWYVASEVVARNENDPATGSPIFGGTLYRTSGPPFGTTFDPATVTVASVGNIRMFYTSANASPALNVAYSARARRSRSGSSTRRARFTSTCISASKGTTYGSAGGPAATPPARSPALMRRSGSSEA